MKKFCFLFCALTAATISFAQTVPGGDMETWRNNIVTDGTVSIPVHAPDGWYGSDSLFIGIGFEIAGLGLVPGLTDTVWHAQLFEENTIVHGGSHSAKLLTTYQDTALVAGTMSNAQINVGITFSPPGISGITFYGGMAVTERPTSVSAWVQYWPGKDTTTGLFGGADTGTLVVQALSEIHGIDSVVSTAFVPIGPTSSTWTQITANLTYVDTIDIVDTIRISFSSSGGATQTLDSSILYVDDVTMTSIPQYSHVAVRNVSASNNLVKVYPNPATNAIYFDGPQNAGLTCTLISVNGLLVATKALTGNDALDVSDLAGGTYFYTINDNSGKTVQRGNVTVNR